MDKVNLLEKFGLFSETWSPKIAGELNGQEVKLVKRLDFVQILMPYRLQRKQMFHLNLKMKVSCMLVAMISIWRYGQV